MTYVAHVLVLQDDRHLVDAVHRRQRDHGALLHVAEERDLAADLGRHLVVGAAEDDVGLDAGAAQLADAVLRRLRLQFVRRADVRQERHVDRKRVFGPLFAPDLADRLEERLPLDVADGAADLDDQHLRFRIAGDAADARLDLVRDVRDRLDRAAEELALALLRDDRLVDLAGGHRAGLRQLFVDEALVVAEVEVGLGAVARDEDLAVLIRRHRAGVDVEVRVELLDGDGDIAGLEDAAESRCGDALADGADDAAGHEDVLRHVLQQAAGDPLKHKGGTFGECRPPTILAEPHGANKDVCTGRGRPRTRNRLPQQLRQGRVPADRSRVERRPHAGA